MCYKKVIIFVFVFLSFSKTNAQEFKLGEVSVAELEEKEHPKDPSAVAAILFKKGEVRFEYTDANEFELITEVTTRIKIYKKEGYNWANQKVGYSLDYSINERVSFSNAYTYNLVGGKIEKTKLKSDGEFIEKINKYWGNKKITMPDVKEGSVIEYKYTIKSSRNGSIRDWDFQTDIPVNYSEFTTAIPEYYVYKTFKKGYIFPKVTINSSQGSIDVVDMYRKEEFGHLVSVVSRYTINYQVKKTTYIIDNVPALKEEVFVNNIDNYISSISHELSSTNLPNTPIKHYSTDWESVVKTIYDYDDFGPELNKTGYFEDDIDQLLSGLSTQREKISAIFAYVKSAVKWNNFKGYSCIDGIKKAYKDKTGNTAEINLMLTAMLRYAGLNANPVLVSTRNNGIAFYASRTAYNTVIAAIETPEGLMLLDATEKYSEPNILPFQDLNWVGRLIREDGTSTEVDLMPKTPSSCAVYMNFVVKNDGSINGKLKKQLTNHNALDFRQNNLVASKESYLEVLETKCNGIEISDYIRDNDLDLSNPIVESFSFKDTKDVEVINDKIYISPLLFLGTKENPFKQEIREYPVDFGFPKQEKYNVNIIIPEGYAIESMPTAINIATGKNLGTYRYMIENVANVIQISSIKEIKTAIVQADFYPILKLFYQQITDKQNEKIVLKKI